MRIGGKKKEVVSPVKKMGRDTQLQCGLPCSKARFQACKKQNKKTNKVLQLTREPEKKKRKGMVVREWRRKEQKKKKKTIKRQQVMPVVTLAVWLKVYMSLFL